MAKDFIGEQGVVQTPARTFDFTDESGLGADDGTPIKSEMVMQLHAVTQKLMADAGFNFNNLPENAVSQQAGDQQIFQALVSKIDTLIQNSTTQNADENKIAKLLGQSLRVVTIDDGGVNDSAADAVNKGYLNTRAIPIGTILPFGSAIVPMGWFECNGAAVSRTSYPLLFAAIGTTWGAGDGSTTFTLPDLRNRIAIGSASGVSGFGSDPTAPESAAITGGAWVGAYFDSSGGNSRRYVAIVKFIIRAL